MAWKEWFNISRHMASCSQALRDANQRLREEIEQRPQTSQGIVLQATKTPVLSVDGSALKWSTLDVSNLS